MDDEARLATVTHTFRCPRHGIFYQTTTAPAPDGWQLKATAQCGQCRDAPPAIAVDSSAFTPPPFLTCLCHP